MNHKTTMASIRLVDGYAPGVLASTIALHMAYYARTWGFGGRFEALLGQEGGQFLEDYAPERDLFVRAETAQGEVVGTIAIDGSHQPAGTARLRWFILAEAARGVGLGRRLMQRATAFCRTAGFARVYLTTFVGLDRARHLYEDFGFRLVHEADGDFWGNRRIEQRFEWTSTMPT